jgi:hypothetical protein
MSLYIKGKIMKNIIALLIISMLVFGFSSCKKNPVEPDLEPGRRDYTWTADTINTFMDCVDRIGGVSLSSLWGVGPSGNGNQIRKYDGKKWAAVTTGFPEDAEALCCFDENNVWVAGNGGYIWHYTGTWNKSMKYTETDVRIFDFLDFYANNSKDIFLCGVAFYNDNKSSRGVIMHYNGYSWSKAYHATDNSEYLRIKKDDKYPNDYFLYSLKWSQVLGQPDTTTYLKYDGKNMQTIYSDLILNYSPAILSNIGGRVYFGMKDGLYRYDNNQLVQFLKLTQNTEDRYMAFGRNEKDLFIAVKDGIMHYNGTDTQYVLRYPKQLVYLDAVVLEKDIFILTTPNYYNAIIYHGTLKD